MENVNKLFFRSASVLQLRHVYRDVGLEYLVEEEPSDSESITGGSNKMPRFTMAKFADIFFVYGFCDGNSLVALKEYQHRYPHR
jgi:hypothetical protein